MPVAACTVVTSNIWENSMKTLIICTALMFGGFGAIGSMIAFSSAPAAACELGNECSW